MMRPTWAHPELAAAAALMALAGCQQMPQSEPCHT
jgi:hypothetical protein